MNYSKVIFEFGRFQIFAKILHSSVTFSEEHYGVVALLARSAALEVCLNFMQK